MRCSLSALGLLLLLFLVALPAHAEEVFVLENGMTVKGRVVREDDEQVIVRPSGFVEENRLTLRRSEIVKRYQNVDPDREPGKTVELDEIPAHKPAGPQNGVPQTTLIANDLKAGKVDPDELLGTDRAMETEGFFARLARVSKVALPESFEGRLMLGVLLLIVMTVLVAGGTRMLGMKAASLHAYSSLGLVLGVFLVADILWSEALLRADRAVWVVPLQVAIWLFVARSTLDAPLSRTVPLFSIVLFASTCFVWATGSLLVSV